MLLCARQCVDSLLPPTSPLGRAGCSHPYPESHEGGAKAPEILRGCRAAQPLSPAMTSLCIYLLLKRRTWGCLRGDQGLLGAAKSCTTQGQLCRTPQAEARSQSLANSSTGFPMGLSRNACTGFKESTCHSLSQFSAAGICLSQSSAAGWQGSDRI